MTPSPKAIPAPLQMHILDHNVTGRHHLDMSTGGLYSSEELRAWQSHLEQGVTHSAVLERLTTGVCIEQGQCQVMGMPKNPPEEARIYVRLGVLDIRMGSLHGQTPAIYSTTMCDSVVLGDTKNVGLY